MRGPAAALTEEKGYGTMYTAWTGFYIFCYAVVYTSFQQCCRKLPAFVE